MKTWFIQIILSEGSVEAQKTESLNMTFKDAIKLNDILSDAMLEHEKALDSTPEDQGQ